MSMLDWSMPRGQTLDHHCKHCECYMSQNIPLPPFWSTPPLSGLPRFSLRRKTHPLPMVWFYLPNILPVCVSLISPSCPDPSPPVPISSTVCLPIPIVFPPALLLYSYYSRSFNLDIWDYVAPRNPAKYLGIEDLCECLVLYHPSYAVYVVLH